MTAMVAPRARALAVVCLLTGILPGCALDTSGEPAPAESITLHDRLARFPVLDVVGVHSDAEVVMRRPRLEEAGVTLPLVVDYGELVIGATAPRTLVLEHLTFAFDRVEVSPERIPPRGTTLDSIRVRLVDPVVAHVGWASETQARATVVADLELEWSVVLPGEQMHPLASERLAGAQIDLDLVLDGSGRILADVDVSLDDVWQWVGLLELRQLDVHLESRERDSPAPRQGGQ